MFIYRTVLSQRIVRETSILGGKDITYQPRFSKAPELIGRVCIKKSVISTSCVLADELVVIKSHTVSVVGRVSHYGL